VCQLEASAGNEKCRDEMNMHILGGIIG